MSDPQEVYELIGKHRVVPVVSEADVDRAMGLTDALVAGGLPIAEMTLRKPGAIEALRAVGRRDDVLAIAGTVINAQQVEAAVDAGAKMIVSPGFSPSVVERAQQLGVPICPGVCTPSELQAALAAGVDVLKFFPAGAAGGVGMLKALSAPFPQARFMPTGGVSADNLLDYLKLDAVIACGGSWMVSPKLYEDGAFDRVEQAVREAVTLAASH
ncbi:Putative KHG/KDPG aldolase [Planctomycetes bacterium MalM25]|nr:Putative KHG/KDPG aldolase [Planctomycetes bacterium MalM25]